jgi:hypothetical protein
MNYLYIKYDPTYTFTEKSQKIYTYIEATIHLFELMKIIEWTSIYRMSRFVGVLEEISFAMKWTQSKA